MSKVLRIATSFALLLSFQYAHAVPSFARQTGLSCNVCHSNPPALTAFGRDFQLKGYVLKDLTAADKVGTTPELQLSKNIPISFLILLSEDLWNSTLFKDAS